jgi:hypothetical protein
MRQRCWKPSKVWADPKPKLEHSKESMFEVPESISPSQNEPPKPEALYLVLRPSRSICVAIGDIESDNRKPEIILGTSNITKLGHSSFWVTSLIAFPILPKVAILK